jgi:peroxiredoxin
MKSKLGWMVLVVLSIGLGTAGWYFTRPAVYVLPTWQGVSLTGQVLRLPDSKNKLTLVNFWSTSCTGCIAEMPTLKKAYQAQHGQGLEIIAVSMAYDHPNFVSAFAQQQQLPFPVVLDSLVDVNNSETEGKHAQHFGGVLATPTTFVLNHKGQVVQQFIGEIHEEELNKLLKQYL